MYTFFLLREVEGRRGRHGRHLSLGRRDMALPKITENQVPLKVFLQESMPQNVASYRFPPEQAVRWEVSQCPLGPVTGIWESIRLRVLHLWAMGTPCSHLHEYLISSVSLPAENQGIRHAHAHCHVRVYLLLGSGSSSVLALTSLGSPGWGEVFCTPWLAEKQNTFSSGNSKWVQIKVN